MISASEFLEKVSEAERKTLEERILDAAQNRQYLDKSSKEIISPFSQGYEVLPQTREWLAEYGWKLRAGRIIPIEGYHSI